MHNGSHLQQKASTASCGTAANVNQEHAFRELGEGEWPVVSDDFILAAIEHRKETIKYINQLQKDCDTIAARLIWINQHAKAHNPTGTLEWTRFYMRQIFLRLKHQAEAIYPHKNGVPLHDVSQEQIAMYKTQEERFEGYRHQFNRQGWDTEALYTEHTIHTKPEDYDAVIRKQAPNLAIEDLKPFDYRQTELHPALHNKSIDEMEGMRPHAMFQAKGAYRNPKATVLVPNIVPEEAISWMSFAHGNF